MAVLSGAPEGRGSDVTERSSAYKLLLDRVNQSQCILFLGAAVHYPPPPDSRFTYPEEHRPPLGAGLAKQLAAGCSFARDCPGEDEGHLQRVSLCYERDNGRNQLVEEIRRAVDENTKPSAAVRALAELPFPLVITTNYDTLFERALRRCDEEKEPQVGIYNPNRESRTPDYPVGQEPSAKRPFLFKMHGDVNSPESIVATDEDYITFVLRMNAAEGFHPLPETFLYKLSRCPTLFVGYSLLDYNLRLLFRTLRWKLDPAQHPLSYSVDVHPDPLVSDVWTREHDFRFIVDDVWDFVPRLYHDVLGREMRA
jgi:hypothetical protein